MTTQIRSLSHRRRIRGSFLDTVLSTGPIAYWPLDESAGTTARCLVNSAQNGTYTGVTLANDSSGPFRTSAPYFDGTNDYIDVGTATLFGAFDGQEGSFMCWERVANAGVWTDGLTHYAVHLYDDGNNLMRLTVGAANNQIGYAYTAGGTSESQSTGGLSMTGWYQRVITWSLSAGANGEVHYYRDGAADGAADTALGAFVGPLVLAVIGAFNVVPGNPWHGWLAHCAIWDRPLTASEIVDLANP